MMNIYYIAAFVAMGLLGYLVHALLKAEEL